MTLVALYTQFNEDEHTTVEVLHPAEKLDLSQKATFSIADPIPGVIANSISCYYGDQISERLLHKQ